MPNWEKLLDDRQERTRTKRKINKNVFCKKNKIVGTKYGYHQYETGKKTCKLCGHINKSELENYNITKEHEEDKPQSKLYEKC